MCLPDWVAKALTAQRQAAAVQSLRPAVPALIQTPIKETITR